MANQPFKVGDRVLCVGRLEHKIAAERTRPLATVLEDIKRMFDRPGYTGVAGYSIQMVSGERNNVQMNWGTLKRPKQQTTERTCVHCGCTDSNACQGGCSWIVKHKATNTGVCSSCVDSARVALWEPRISLDETQVLSLLKRKVQEGGGQKPVAKRLGITPQFLCDVVNGRRGISGKLAAKLGYQRRVSFESSLNSETSC